MWGGLYWAKNFFGGFFWGPPSGVTPVPPIAITGGHYGKKKKERKRAPWEDAGPSPALTLRDTLAAIANEDDEEELLAMMGLL